MQDFGKLQSWEKKYQQSGKYLLQEMQKSNRETPVCSIAIKTQKPGITGLLLSGSPRLSMLSYIRRTILSDG
jgi:hypothetical protein